MKLRLKYGFKMLFRNPVRIAASFLAAIIAFGIAGMCIFMQTYSAIPWYKEMYFEYSGFEHGPDPYMGFVWGRNMSDSVMGTSYFTKDAFLESEKKVASVGYGYAFMFLFIASKLIFLISFIIYYKFLLIFIFSFVIGEL